MGTFSQVSWIAPGMFLKCCFLLPVIWSSSFWHPYQAPYIKSNFESYLVESFWLPACACCLSWCITRPQHLPWFLGFTLLLCFNKTKQTNKMHFILITKLILFSCTMVPTEGIILWLSGFMSRPTLLGRGSVPWWEMLRSPQWKGTFWN
jgi:hypothetical protein